MYSILDFTCTRAKVALQEATEQVVSTLMLEADPLEISFSGLGNFSTKVVFAKVCEGPPKQRLVKMAGCYNIIIILVLWHIHTPLHSINNYCVYLHTHKT